MEDRLRPGENDDAAECAMHGSLMTAAGKGDTNRSVMLLQRVRREPASLQGPLSRGICCSLASTATVLTCCICDRARLQHAAVSLWNPLC
jgi:hypothetical protein